MWIPGLCTRIFPVQYIPFRLKELDIGRGSPGKATKPDAMM